MGTMAEYITRIEAAPPHYGAVAAADLLVFACEAGTRAQDPFKAAAAIVAYRVAEKARHEARNGLSAYVFKQVLEGYPDGSPELASLTEALGNLRDNVLAQIRKATGGGGG